MQDIKNKKNMLHVSICRKVSIDSDPFEKWQPKEGKSVIGLFRRSFVHVVFHSFIFL